MISLSVLWQYVWCSNGEIFFMATRWPVTESWADLKRDYYHLWIPFKVAHGWPVLMLKEACYPLKKTTDLWWVTDQLSHILVLVTMSETRFFWTTGPRNFSNIWPGCTITRFFNLRFTQNIDHFQFYWEWVQKAAKRAIKFYPK